MSLTVITATACIRANRSGPRGQAKD
jgi:hypothetical protein